MKGKLAPNAAKKNWTLHVLLHVRWEKKLLTSEKNFFPGIFFSSGEHLGYFQIQPKTFLPMCVWYQEYLFLVIFILIVLSLLCTLTHTHMHT